MTAPSPSSNVLTVAELAAVLRVSRMTVYRLIRSGELPAIRFGRSLRVSTADLRDFITRSYRAAVVDPDAISGARSRSGKGFERGDAPR